MSDAGQIDTGFYRRCIGNMEHAYEVLQKTPPDDVHYGVCRSACVQEFELILEQSGKLLRRCLKKWFHSPKAVDRLTFKDVFRRAAHHGLISLEEAERWLAYRDNRNSTTHDYGEKFAETTLLLLPDSIRDAKALQQSIAGCADD